MASPTTLEELAVENLKDLYDAEHKLLDSMPEMLQCATDPELRHAIEMHRGQTEGQIRRLEQVFQSMGQQPERKNCPGLAGLVQEFRQHMKEIQDPQVRDAALIEAAQKAEHYEIAAYGTARCWAQQLGHNDVAQLLEQTLREEEETDRKLTQIATRGGVNRDAQRQAA